jgi:hypothetical protein
MKLGHPPIAPMLPVAMIGISARPADALLEGYNNFGRTRKGSAPMCSRWGRSCLGRCAAIKSSGADFTGRGTRPLRSETAGGAGLPGEATYVCATSGSSGPGHERTVVECTPSQSPGISRRYLQYCLPSRPAARTGSGAKDTPGSASGKWEECGGVRGLVTRAVVGEGSRSASRACRPLSGHC